MTNHTHPAQAFELRGVLSMRGLTDGEIDQLLNYEWSDWASFYGFAKTASPEALRDKVATLPVESAQ